MEETKKEEKVTKIVEAIYDMCLLASDNEGIDDYKMLLKRQDLAEAIAALIP